MNNEWQSRLLDYLENEANGLLSVRELTDALGVESGDDFREFVKLLAAMEETGQIVRTRSERYGLPERMNLVVGRLQMKARGYGFVIAEDGSEDIYIPGTEMNGAMSGDKVMVRVEAENKMKTGSAKHREGRVIRVLERQVERVVGRFVKHEKHGFVTPADKRFPQDVWIGPDHLLDAHDGYVVVAEILEYPTATRGPVGKIVEVLGHPDEPGMDILTIVRKYNLPEKFSDEVLAAVERIPRTLSEKDYEGRRDLRSERIVTIDGEDAKDLDDAVHVKRLKNGHFELGVHIADVGYYVKEGSSIDKEAYRRGTSVYLVDRVIPMLPQRLSNDICSLNPQVDRLTLSCIMEIDEKGAVVSHDIFPSVIHTRERMTYNNVRKILLREDEEVMQRYRDLLPDFELMEELALILREKRMRRGAVDFDFDEVKVVVDPLGAPVDIVARQRSIAERIIEEFMLAANETVAEHFHWLGVPFVYRIHEEPDMGKMLDLNQFLHNFGYSIRGVGNRVHPRALQDVLNELQGKREQRMLSSLMLRSMRQARYAPECTGHFGLAAEYYTHFTSPIRRYPDLVIHRIIRENLLAPFSAEREGALAAFVADAAVQSSERERIAQDAERECDQLKMVEYMQAHLFEPFDGLISGVTSFGLFVQLQNGVEGLIHISYLTDDYYALNERLMALVGERTRRVFRLGDPVRVQAIAANKETLSIDFELLEHLREATFVSSGRGGEIIYDEDLSRTERRRAIEERRLRSEEGEARGRRRTRERLLADTHGNNSSAYGKAKRETDRPNDKAKRSQKRRSSIEIGHASVSHGGYEGPAWAGKSRRKKKR
ncbi:ribonuclease R [Alicyclobacillus tolerans]|uniref:Ribonuclease R n=1 Tax=Alicyclobacillus tolerans TaxID=90970 RepID=A0ABT9LZM9_9BACL|nr:ribonuclease R [Alicyclobacillus tengchongensis]MDP9729712.1 ribonuclease R [Alicyclobacillus tengchongensis]